LAYRFLSTVFRFRANSRDIMTATHSLVVKICGLATAESLDWALEAGADMVGFVHFPKSPRHVDLETARMLASRARGRAKIVVLTVDADDAQIAAVIDTLAPDFLQLHGQESPGRVAAIRARVPVIKALGIANADDVATVAAYDSVADLLLFDAKPPRDAPRPGGLGRSFDWSLLDRMPAATPFLLSGGLHPTNVGEAITRVRPFGVDVSSGVESAPGVKDRAKIDQFIQNARAAAAAARTGDL
jgi:phosphoribosylanthranilate isomerase